MIPKFPLPGRRLRYGYCILPVVLAGILALWHDELLLAPGRFLVLEDPLQPADLIHVIAGPDYRAEHGIRLLQGGYGKILFFTGGWCTIHHEYHGERGKRLATSHGVPAAAIATDDFRVTSTYSEALRLKEFILRSPVPIRSVIVVSDPYHMRRARWTYSRILGDGIRIQMSPVPFDMTPYRRYWWSDARSRQQVAEEYVKIAYYHARYQLAIGPLRDWLASLDRY